MSTSAKLKSQNAPGGSKVEKAGLSVKTNVADNGKVKWEHINSAPVTSSNWRAPHLSKVRHAMKENKSAIDALKNPSQTGDGLSQSSLAQNNYLNMAPVASSATDRVSNTNLHDRKLTQKPIKIDDDFIDSVFDLPTFKEPRKATIIGKLHSNDALDIAEVGDQGSCPVKINSIAEVKQIGTDPKFNKDYLLSVTPFTPFTTSEINYISSNEPAARLPLAELHVYKHRARACRAEDDADACYVANATKSAHRAASVSPQFLIKNAGDRYAAVERVREARRIQHTDPAALAIGAIVDSPDSDDLVEEYSPHRSSPTRAAKEAGRRRFEDIIKRLRETQTAEAALTDPAIIECRVKAGPRKPYEASDRLHAEHMKWDNKTQRTDSGYSSPPRGDLGGGHLRQGSKDSAAIASDESSPVKKSHDSGFDSPSKSMTFNPKAMEFVSLNGKKHAATMGDTSPSKHPRKPISSLFIPQQQMAAHLPLPGPVPQPMNMVAPLMGCTQLRLMPAQPPAALNINGGQVRHAMPSTMLPPPSDFAPVPRMAPFDPPQFSVAPPLPAPMMPMTAPTGPTLPMQLVTMMNGPQHTTAPANAIPFVNGRPPAPCRKPRNPDPIAQQNYEAYVEYRKATDPAYALECKRRQAKRFERQRGV